MSCCLQCWVCRWYLSSSQSSLWYAAYIIPSLRRHCWLNVLRFSPLLDVTCPDTMPCSVVCDTFILSMFELPCRNIDIKCSENASCDVLFLAGTGVDTSVDCGNTTHSCAVFCDPGASFSQWRCNSTASCNCNSNCAVDSCHKGYEFVTPLFFFLLVPALGLCILLSSRQ